MMKKIVHMMLRGLLVMLLFLGTAELFTRIVGMKPSKKWDVRVTPHNFFSADTLLGWKLAKGRYTLTVLDTSNRFIANINGSGERLSSVSGNGERFSSKSVNICCYKASDFCKVYNPHAVIFINRNICGIFVCPLF